jgi:hypothetical protein
MANNEYRALVGINYVPKGAEKGEDGYPEKRVEAGDKITDMPDNAIKHELAAKHIEKWVDRQTENVVRPEDEVPHVEGVKSRHANEGQDIVLKGVNE